MISGNKTYLIMMNFLNEAATFLKYIMSSKKRFLGLVSKSNRHFHCSFFAHRFQFSLFPHTILNNWRKLIVYLIKKNSYIY